MEDSSGVVSLDEVASKAISKLEYVTTIVGELLKNQKHVTDALLEAREQQWDEAPESKKPNAERSSEVFQRPQYFMDKDEALFNKFKRHTALPLVVTGPNSCGKSTFINTLLNVSVHKKILPVGQGSVTKRPVRLAYAPESQARVEVYRKIGDYFEDGRRETHDLSTLWKQKSAEGIASVLKKELYAPDYVQSDPNSPDTNEWCRKMVVIYIPSPFLKKKIDVYDTPGPDLEHDNDVLKENFSILLSYLQPIALTLFLVPNASVSPDVAKAHEMMWSVLFSSDRDTTSENRPPEIFYLNVKQSVKTIRNTDYVQSVLKGDNSDDAESETSSDGFDSDFSESDEDESESDDGDSDRLGEMSSQKRMRLEQKAERARLRELHVKKRFESDMKAIGLARDENFEKFRTSMEHENAPIGTKGHLKKCKFDIVDMLEMNDAMIAHRTDVARGVVGVAAQHINEMSDYFLRAVCSATYRFYSHLLSSGRRTQDTVDRIKWRCREFIAQVKKGFQQKVAPVIEEYPKQLAAVIEKKNVEIMREVRSMKISQKEKRIVAAKQKAVREISVQLQDILYRLVVRPCNEQLMRDLSETLSSALSPVMKIDSMDASAFTSENEKNEVFSALRLQELNDFLHMFYPELKDNLEKSGVSAVTLRSALGRILGGLWKGVTSVLVLFFAPVDSIRYLWDAFRKISDEDISEWARTQLQKIQKKLMNMNAMKLLGSTDTIENVIVSRLEQALQLFQNETESPMSIETVCELEAYRNEIDELHFKALASLLGDGGTRETALVDPPSRGCNVTIIVPPSADDPKTDPRPVQVSLKPLAEGASAHKKLYSDVILSQTLSWMGVKAVAPIKVAFYVDPVNTKQPMYGLEVPFQTVVDLIEGKHPPQAEAALQVGYGLVKALYDLRSHGVTHVDVCSESIYFSLCLETCVLDWTSVEIEGLPQANSSVTGSAEQPAIDHMSTRTNGEDRDGVPREYNLQFVGRLMHELYPGWVHGDMSDPISLDSEPCNCTYCNLKNLCLDAHESNKASVKEIKEEFEKHLPFKVPSDSPKGDEKDKNLPECNCRICTEKKRRQVDEEKKGGGVNRLVKGIEQNISV